MRTFVVCAAIVFGLAAAASATSTNSDWFARTWQTDDGLPYNTIQGMVQTSDGYLWLGTPAGLVNFDGARFQKFEFTNSIFTGNRGVVTMIRSADGGVWMAMNRGAVAYLNGSRTKVFTAADGLADFQVHELAEAGDGTLWISFVGGEGRRIKDGKVMRLPPDETLPNLLSVVSDAGKNIWAVTGNGELVVYREGEIHHLAHLGDMTAELAAAKDEGIWVCAGTRLLRFYPDGRITNDGDFNTGRCAALMEDSQGGVWIGTAFGGLIRYDGTTFETIATSRPRIQSLLEDREGNIWVGTIGGGLNRIRRRVVQIEGTEAGLPIETVRSLAEDAQGTIWAATENGMLARRFDGGWRSLSANENWKQYNVSSVTSDHQGGLWLGTRNHKLLHWREGQSVPEEIALAGNVLSLVACTNGDVWVGEIAEKGHCLQHLHAGTLTTHRFPDVRTIRAAVQDANGTIWFASARGDLLRVQGDEVTREPLPESDAGRSIHCLAATADGSLWIGYDGLGVGWLKAGRYHRFSAAQGLFNDYVSQIVGDDQGWLWFGSDHGIFKARERDFEDVVAGKLSRVDCVYYGSGEGAANLQANFGSAPGALRSHDGKIWIPTRSGLAEINPDLIHNRTDQLPVLTQVIVDERTIARRNTIADDITGDQAVMDLAAEKIKLQVPPDYRRLRIEFTTLSFVGIDNIRFRYRLIGLDRDWQEAGEQRYTTYSRLPAGEYTFEVMACNSEGVWNAAGTQLSFTVLPFFWNTWWFRILAGCLLLAVVVGSVRYFEVKRTQRQLARLENEHAIERERARIARDLHDDLGGSLTKVALLSELALKRRHDPARAGESVEAISKTARDAIKSLDETVWAISPRNDTLPHLIDYIGQSAVEFLNAAGINCRVDLIDSLPPLAVSARVRHHVFLAVKEVLTNIARHAEANEVRLRTAVDHRTVAMTIEDNGHGFTPSPDRPFADGLHNLRQRMADIGGECEVASTPGAGTKVRLMFPSGLEDQ